MKKLLCLVMAAVLMLSVFTACGNQTGTGTADGVQSELGKQLGAPDLSGKTIKILSEETWVSGISLSDILPRFQQIEELTGCTIVWDTVPGGSDYGTVVQTRLTASPEECPDIVVMGSGHSSLSKYINDDLLYDYTKAYDVCPNIQRFWESRSDLRGIFTYFDGGIYNLLADTYLTTDGQAQKIAMDGDNALWYRADIANELGFTTYPKTIDELYALLTAVKNAYPDMVPMHMWNWECWESVRVFSSAYGLHFNNEQSGSFFYPDENGKVIYEPATEACKEWLAEMNKWYKEGLIVVGASEDQKIGAVAQGKIFSGFYADVTTLCETQLKQTNPDAYFLYMPFPTKEGYELTYMGRSEYSDSVVVVNNGSEEQCRAACQFLDWAFMSDYGIYSEMCGVMGEGWDFGENGEMVINEEWLGKILSQEIVRQASGAHVHFNGPSLNTYEAHKAWSDAEDAYIANHPEYQEPMSEEQKANWLEINEFNTQHYCTYFPAFYMEDEEQAKLNALTADLYTFTNEMLTKYILGTADLSKFQTEFVDKLYARLNLKEVTEIQQKYYDIYVTNSTK